MNKWEEFLLKWTGKLIMIIASGGFFVTVFFDRFARGVDQSLGWLQLSGLFAFFFLFVLGHFIDDMLEKAKLMIDEYLQS